MPGNTGVIGRIHVVRKMLTRNPSEHTRDPRETAMIDSEANNYFIGVTVTEAGKEAGISTFSIYILISVVHILQKKTPRQR